MIKVLMKPHLTELAGEGGINRVVEAYFKHLPAFDIELVKSDATTYDLVAAHAGITGPDCTIAHLHGIYFTADYKADEWEWWVNQRVIAACRNAKYLTVPSDYVAETIRRDMRVNPFIIPHGIDWREWQHKKASEGFVLWNKTRRFDVCDNSILDILVRRFPDIPFVSTLPTPSLDHLSFEMWPRNFKILENGGKTPHEEMRDYVQRAGVYLSIARETFGIGTLEAMASGVPVLGWNWGGNMQLVQHGINGYLAEPNNIDDLCEGLNYCLKYRKTLGTNGRELARAWAWEKAAGMVAEVYRLAMEDEPATVSVVIPVYNKSPEKVSRAINSVLSQTLRPDEVIVVNDGSNDNGQVTHLIRTEYDGLVEYIEQSNQGVASARNNGISHTNSKYITCLDADDWFDPTFLEVCIKALESDRSLGIAYTGLRSHNQDGSSVVSPWPGAFNPDKQLSYPKQNQIPTACVFRREAWARVGGYRSRYCPLGAGSEDAALWSAICSIGYNAKLIMVDNSERINRAKIDVQTIKKELESYGANYMLYASGEELPEDEIIDMAKYDEFDNLKSELSGKLYAIEELTKENKRPAVLFNYSMHGGFVHDNPDYSEVDWLSMCPWAKDGLHPFASVATPKRYSHPVRQYDRPDISVIIPVGPGHEKEVINALDSLEMQHFRRWEVILSFDCKTSQEWFRPFLKAYPYVHYTFTQYGQDIKSVGAGYARNRGVELARAPLIFFLDADDVLADARAFDKMLAAWNQNEAIIYSDYVGKAQWDYDSALREFGDKLLSYNTKKETAVFSKQAADYDPDLAQRQPEHTGRANMPYYHWCLVSVLIPKAWHDAIGGFDESMETWEDVEYMWRLARAGYCFYRVPEPLVMYSYIKGSRREVSAVTDADSLQKHHNLIQYIKQKFENLKVIKNTMG